MAAACGALLAVLYAAFIHHQGASVPRISSVFTHAPQGDDQWMYFSIVRAIWRSPTLFSYSYPFELWWPTPPVLLQLPLAFVAWLALVTGIPVAFEVARVCGTAAGAFALSHIGHALFEGRQQRTWYWIAVAGAGGWFWILSIGKAFEISGSGGLTELWEFLPLAQGRLYHWKMYLPQNLAYVLETIYHALVFGTIAALLRGKLALAALLMLATWFSNPFSAVALTLPVGLWMLQRLAREPKSLVLWRSMVMFGIVVLVGLGYYAWFLKRYPLLSDLQRLFHVELLDRPSWIRSLALWGPWVAVLAVSAASRKTRSVLWGDNRFSLICWLGFTQLLLAEQQRLIGDRAIQPMHFVRGYLTFACAVCVLRCAIAWAGSARVPVWAMLLLVSSMPDNLLYWIRESALPPAGFVNADIHLVLEKAAEMNGSRVIITDWPADNLAISALTNHVPYAAQETLLVPFEAERFRRLEEELKPGGSVAGLGITMAILSHGSVERIRSLQAQGWKIIYENEEYRLLVPD